MKKSVLFVCLGNICRSPSAEAVFTAMVNQKGLSAFYDIDSAGTSGWHAGGPADRRMSKHASRRGYELTSISRKFDPQTDFDRFEYIIGMDDENIRTLRAMARNAEDRKKIHKMTDFRQELSYNEVPDPYYGGEEGFELVLDLLEDACAGLLEKTEASRKQ
ncbi:MAG TPA: low molecular weight protein-tyrosine-phosphatase [Prolixibacteraceae bacterium]|nr:low molecular weight protein-tyrosine-phosphatase [Prolixibacteraceae bacterium]